MGAKFTIVWSRGQSSRLFDLGGKVHDLEGKIRDSWVLRAKCMVSIKGIASPHSVFCTCTMSGESEPRKTHDDVWVRWAWLETAHLRLPDSSPSGRSVRREGDFALCRYDVKCTRSQPLPRTFPQRLGSSTKAVVCGHSCVIVQELCENRGGRPELSVLTSLLVSMDVKNY